MNIEAFATTVASEVYVDEDKKAIDPITIMMVIGLVVQVGKLIYDCYKERSVDKIKNPNVFDRVAFKLMVVRQVGVRDFAEIRGNKLVNSLIAQAGSLNEEDISNLLEESKNQII